MYKMATICEELKKNNNKTKKIKLATDTSLRELLRYYES
jgi:hypothetical protein